MGRDAIELLTGHVGVSTEDGKVATPTVVDDPAGTVGIGDIVSASSFAIELAVTGARDGDL